MHISTRTKIH